MTNDKTKLEEMLAETFEDYRLTGEEKQNLRGIASQLDDENIRFLKNRAFDLFREHLFDNYRQGNRALQWLEKTIKVLDGGPSFKAPDCYFSPGEACRRAILDSCLQARKSIDVCVFTISDNNIRDALLEAHRRGIEVRIITDNDKSEDKGSDIYFLSSKGLPIKMDRSKNHMHHKFAIFDNDKLLNGSFNWTRSASERNQENILIVYHPLAISEFQACFEELWEKF